MIDFDIHAPMDAPLRARAAREKREHEEALKAMRSPTFRKAIAKICHEAAAKMGLSRLKKDGTPDRRFGPRMGPPR